MVAQLCRTAAAAAAAAMRGRLGKVLDVETGERFAVDRKGRTLKRGIDLFAGRALWEPPRRDFRAALRSP